MLGAEMQGVQDRRWKSERFIVFQTVILQRARHVTASHAIRRRIEKRLDSWGAGKHAMLVGDTLRSCEEYLTAALWEETADHRAQTYHSLVLRGKLWSAVRYSLQDLRVYPTSIACLPAPQASNLFSIRCLIAWDAVTWRARCRITVWKTMNCSKFHHWSRTPCILALRIPTNRRPTFPLGAS